MTKRSQRLRLEQLEARALPATFGIPWPDPQHLTVSFAADGTLVDNTASNLFGSLDAVATTAAWKTEFLRALETWLAPANINVGVVADGGQPVGTAGAIQHDPRFGDLRITGRAMPGDVGALNYPYDPVDGTRAGDVQLNTALAYGIGSSATFDLYTALLDEVGNVFGLADTTDSTSALDGHYEGMRGGLNANDIGAIQGLYGARAPDAFEGVAGNETLATAAPISLPNVEGDVTTATDVDLYSYSLPSYSESSVTVRVQTAGISLMTPKLTVYDASGDVVDSAVTTDPLAGGVSVTLTNVTPGTSYYFKVEAGSSDFGVGGYRLKVDSGQVSEVQIADLDALFDRTDLNAVTHDGHTNDDLNSATNLSQSQYQIDPRFSAAIGAGIEDVNDADYYSVTVPTSLGGESAAVAVNVAAIQGSTLDPAITVYDANGNVVSADILVNDRSSYLVQIPNAALGSTYYLKVSPDVPVGSDPVTTGDYLLGVQYRAAPLVVPQLANDTLTSNVQALAKTLVVGESQSSHFVLSASAPGATVATAVRLSVFDQNNQLVFALTVLAGQTVSADIFLNAGSYHVYLVAAAQDSSALSPLTYQLRGQSLTDPIDPIPIDPHNNAPLPPIVVSNPPPSDPPPDPGTLDPITNPWVPI